MKKTIFALVTISLLVACGADKEKTEGTEGNIETTVSEAGNDGAGMKMAYYSQDSVAKYFDFFREQDSIVQKMQLAFQKEMERRQKGFQNYILKQENLRQNGMLTDNQIMAAQQTIQQKEQALMQFQQQRGAEIEAEGYKIMEVIGNKVKAYSEEFSAENGIDILFVYADGFQIKYINPSMDVTEEFTKFLNESETELQKSLEE